MQDRAEREAVDPPGRGAGGRGVGGVDGFGSGIDADDILIDGINLIGGEQNLDLELNEYVIGNVLSQ